MKQTVLALNGGSSSLKFGLYRVSAPETKLLLAGEAEAIGSEGGQFHAEDACGNALLSESASFASDKEAVARIVKLLSDSNTAAPAVVGHRIVHGGPHLRSHCIIDHAVLDKLEGATAFAPLHVPQALAVIGFAKEHFPGVPQVACFDTDFHKDLPDISRVLPIAKKWQAEGVQRYGFHGLSCESILCQLRDDRPDRIIIAHLGSGASITAVKAGKSVDTSMGLTPTGGVMMGTRSGDLDPGVLIYLAREKRMGTIGLEDLVDRESGLLGVSGLSSDLRKLRDASASNTDARFAIEMLCYSVRKQIAAMIAALDGVDCLVFTGGIGENDAQTRSEICRGLSWAGVVIDEDRNRLGVGTLSGVESQCRVLMLPSKEDERIAHHSFVLALEAMVG